MRNAFGEIKCPICDGNKSRLLSSVGDVEYYTTLDLYDYYECLSCKVIFLNNPPLDSLSVIYPDNYYAVQGPSNYSNKVQLLLEKIKTHFDRRMFSKSLALISSKTITCLDVGGGAGWVMNIVRSADPRIKDTWILDINENSKSIAEKNGHRYICGLVSSIEMQNKFDFVLLLNLIEHVDDPRSVLIKIFSSMNHGGILLIKTPNTDSLNRYLFQKRYWGGYHAPRHWVLFNKRNFINLAKECGFSVETFSYTQGAPQWAASILGTFFYSDSHAKSNVEPMHERFMFPILLMLFAFFDFIRLPFFNTDQMIILLRKS